MIETRADEQVHLAYGELFGAVVVLDHLDRLDDGKQRIAVLLDLGPLVAFARILDRELVQPEFRGHLVELRGRRVDNGDPHEAVGPAHVFADVLDRDVGELLSVLVGDAGDQHEGPLWSGAAAS